MTGQAPRIDPRLIASLGRLDDPRLPVAETWRRAGDVAERLGTPRPSYEQIRLYVHESRRRRQAREAARDLVFDVWLRARPPEALLELPEILQRERG